MEEFEIIDNYLLNYVGEDKEEVTVPEGVEYILGFAFYEYKKIKSIILPDSLKRIDQGAFWSKGYLQESVISSITYRGITFNSYGSDDLYIHKAIEMIAERDYSKKLDRSLKYQIILKIYFKEKDLETEFYIKKNFKKFFVFIMENFRMTEDEKLNAVKKLVGTGKFVTKRNIDTYIKYADENNYSKVFDLLTEYKEK